MAVIDGPPAAQELVVWRIERNDMSGQVPRFLGANEVNEIDGALEVLVCRNILVVGTGCAVIGETEPMPVPEMHVQQALIGTIETDASFG